MAIKKELEINNTGVIANYTLIEGIHLSKDLATGNCDVMIRYSIYRDEMARKEGRIPIATTSMVTNGKEFQKVIMGLGYDILKEADCFHGCEDV